MSWPVSSNKKKKKKTNVLAWPDNEQTLDISLARDFPSELKHLKSGGQHRLPLFSYVYLIYVFMERSPMCQFMQRILKRQKM